MTRLRELAATLALGACVCLAADAAAPPPFPLPADLGAHASERSEWWRLTGNLHDGAGHRYGYALTVFRFGVRGAHDRSFFPATLAVVDEENRRFVHGERQAREALGLGGVATGRLAVRVDDWSVTSTAPGRLAARASYDDAAIALEAVAAKRPAGAALATRLRTKGAMQLNGRRFHVDGTSWFEHRLGTALARDSGWDRFAITLNDGRELLFERTRAHSGANVTRGMIVGRDGNVTTLAASAFTLTNWGGAQWRSPHSGVSYPSLWKLVVAQAGIAVSIEPAVADQELATSGGGTPYWDGAVEVRDEPSGGVLIGSGYAQLTGYARPLSL